MSSYVEIPGLGIYLGFHDADTSSVIEHLRKLATSERPVRVFSDGQQCVLVDFSAVPWLRASTDRPDEAQDLAVTLSQIQH